MKRSRLVMVESPFSSKEHSREECVRYALWCCADATARGECVAMASHLFYTLFLPEDKDSRALGLECRDFVAKATMAAVVRYLDLGVTQGMFRDVDCTAVVEERRLIGHYREDWLAGLWPPGSLRPRVL
jgi:hypothetical protein